MKLTDEQTERFKQLYNEGKNDTEIAFEMDVSLNSVRVKRKELGWQPNGTRYKTPRKRFTQDEINRMIELAKTHTVAEIATLIGASKFGVRDLLYRNGVMPVSKRTYERDTDWWNESCGGFDRDPCRGFTPTTDMLVMQYLSEGYSWTQIAKMLHRDLDLMKRYYTQHKDRLLRAHEAMMRYDGIYAYKMQNRTIEEAE
jgi:transposase